MLEKQYFGIANPLPALFKNLPPIDSSIDYAEQSTLLQCCNLALLDEVKRLELENREIKKGFDKRGDMLA
jgi:hypothetical protein